MNMESIKNNKKKHLIVVDLDGTLLNQDYATLNQKNKQVLQELQKKGHKICIATGRNYLSALPFYHQIGLDTFLTTYNGAYVNHPLRKEIQPLKFKRISNSTIREILTEKAISENLLNVLFDSVHRETISTSDDVYYQEIFFNGNPPAKVEKGYKDGEKANLWEHLQGQDCLQLVLEFPFFQGKESSKMDEIILALGKYNKNSIIFDWGKKMKAEKIGDKILISDNTKIIFKVRNKHADKFEAIEAIAAYHNIPLNQIIAFGNDVNDKKMLSGVRKFGGIGIAVSNSDLDLKITIASDNNITKLPSYEGGVAEYLKDYFNL